MVTFHFATELAACFYHTVLCGFSYNATDKAAVKRAQLGRPVEKMMGGVTGELNEDFELLTESLN